MSMGTGTLDGFLASIGGFGTHTNITLFLPTLGIESDQIRSDQIKSNQDLGKSYSYLLIEKNITKS